MVREHPDIRNTKLCWHQENCCQQSFSCKIPKPNITALYRKITSLFLLALVAAAGSVSAQPRAIGGRFGYNIELTYQHSLRNNMLEVDLGITPFITHRIVNKATGNELYHYGRVQAVAAYDWLHGLNHGFNWYIGVAAGISYGYGEYYDIMGYSRFGVPVGAQLGIEYPFKIPLNLSADWRPMINVFGLRQGNFYTNLLNIAIGVKYRF